MLTSKTTVIVPAFNESATIGSVIEDLRSVTDSIVVVDDGSSDNTGDIARKNGALVLRHVINRGLGASLQTGFKKALELGAEYIVTFDADGQHRAADIERLIAPIKDRRADVAIGTRDFSKNAPVLRRVYNRVANLIGLIFFGIYVKDTQSGLRAFRRDILMKFRPLGDRMEVSSEIIGELNRLGARIIEVPIDTIYTEYSMSKGQSFLTGIKTFIALVLHRFK